MAWNESQQVALAMVPKFAAALSLTGSLWIIIEVVTDKEKYTRVYHRMLLVMSIYDVLESIWNFCSTWPIPRGTNGVFGAAGTTATCTAQGFFLQLGLAIPIYNASLSIYYLLVIRYGMKEETLRKRVEPIIHAIPFILGLGTSIVSVRLDLFNNANLWCWIAPYPPTCLDSLRYGDQAPCERGNNAWVYRWAFYFAPLWFCIFLSSATIVMVYIKVLKLEMATLSYRRPVLLGLKQTISTNYSAGCTAYNGVVNATSSNTANKNEADTAPECISFNEDEKSESLEYPIDYSQTSVASTTGDDGKIDVECASGDTSESMTDSLPCSRGKANNTQRSVSFRDGNTSRPSEHWMETPKIPITSTTSGDSAEAQSTDVETNGKAAFQSWRRNAQISMRKMASKPGSRNPRSNDVFRQAVWYVGAFYMTHLFSTINRVLQQVNGSTYFPLLLVHSFFDPLQGFLYFVVYRRPRYLRHRSRNPELTRFHAIKMALSWSFLDKHPSERSLNSHSESQVRTSLRVPQDATPPKEPSAKSLNSNASSGKLVTYESGLLLLADDVLDTVSEERDDVTGLSDEENVTSSEFFASLPYANQPLGAASAAWSLHSLDEFSSSFSEPSDHS